MNRFRLIVMALALCAASAQGQIVRAFVSTGGIDNANCSVAAPCRTFGAAMIAVSAGGEVLAVDSGGYGPFTIDKSVTVIAAPGAHVAVTASSAGDGITVNAPSGLVGLRGLFVNGRAGSGYGIRVTNAGILMIDRTTVRGFNWAGVLLEAPSLEFSISDVVVRDNASVGGIVVAPLSGNASGSIHASRIENNQDGIVVDTRSSVSVSEVVSSGNFRGLYARSNESGQLASVVVENSRFVSNVYGAYADACNGTSRIRVSGSTIAHNTVVGIQSEDATCGGPSAAEILSRGNNTVVGNNSAETFDGAFAAK